ncbi:MAG: ribonuclease P protein component [Chloroflexi bacterium]|nr:ribonuclease P protein component [Chloroflexota bacterium]
MKRAFSLRRGEDFQRAWDGGKSWSHPLVILRIRTNSLSINRFGFVAGKKLGNAVARNRAKRRLREAMRHRLTQIASGYDIIVIARTGVVRATFNELDTAIETLIQRAGLPKRD